MPLLGTWKLRESEKPFSKRNKKGGREEHFCKKYVRYSFLIFSYLNSVKNIKLFKIYQ